MPTTISSERSTQSADQRLRARRRSAPQVVREPVGARVQLARRSAPRPRTTTATRVRRARRLRLEAARAGSVRRDTPPPVAFHSASSCAPLAPRRAAAARETGASGVGGDLLAAARCRWPTIRSIVAALEQVGAVLQRAAQPAAPSSTSAATRSNLARAPVARLERRQLEPRQRQRRRAGAFCSANITWKSGVWLRLALRAAAPPPAARTAGPGARSAPSVALPHPAEQLAEARVAGQVARAAPAC